MVLQLPKEIKSEKACKLHFIVKDKKSTWKGYENFICILASSSMPTTSFWSLATNKDL